MYTDEQKLIEVLEERKWKEPTKEEYPTYLDVKKRGDIEEDITYFEDIHAVWKAYRPIKK